MKTSILIIKRIILISGALFFLFFNIVSAQGNQTPNIIIINMDDMGYGDINTYHNNPYSTKNMDAMATAGMKFTQFYSAQSVCSASRAALLTGCYPNRLGISGALMPKSPIGLNPKEKTIASLLKEKGYRTCITGKWHLGSRPEYNPCHYGFDEFFGLLYSNDMWAVDYSGKPIIDTNDWKRSYPPLMLMRDSTPARNVNSLSDQGRLTEAYTNYAVNFIRKNRKGNFFLYLAYSMPHVPLAVSPPYKNKSGNGLYADVMQELDESVGKILKEISNAGIDSNTLIILTSDNGPWLTFGNHAGNTAGLREGKGSIWEGGMRVPCIMQWKGMIAPGTHCDGLATQMDLLPTIAGLCKINLPGKKIDGTDIAILLKDAKAKSPREEFAYYYDRNSLKAIRKGKWKLVFTHNSQTYMTDSAKGADGYPGKYSSIKVEKSLYDLNKDPEEKNNMINEYPEIADQLEITANKYRRELGDDLTGKKGSMVRPAADADLRPNTSGKKM